MKERSVPIRPGIEEHLVGGKMSLFDFGIYTLIHIQADYRTGIWRGSAPRIMATAPRGASLRKIQRALEHFEESGYLKSFRKQGERGNCPHLIDKFTVRSGARKGYRLNATKSDSWQSPFYELVPEDDAVTMVVPVAEGDAYSRSKKKEVRSKKEPTHAAVPPCDSRFQPFVDFAHQIFGEKHHQRPTWGPRDLQNLKALLERSKGVSTEELSRRFRNFLASTEPFTAKQGDSLSYFSTHFDTFIDGPIARPQLGETNGTISGSRPTGAVRPAPGKDYGIVPTIRVSQCH